MTQYVIVNMYSRWSAIRFSHVPLFIWGPMLYSHSENTHLKGCYGLCGTVSGLYPRGDVMVKTEVLSLTQMCSGQIRQMMLSVCKCIKGYKLMFIGINMRCVFTSLSAVDLLRVM